MLREKRRKHVGKAECRKRAWLWEASSPPARQLFPEVADLLTRLRGQPEGAPAVIDLRLFHCSKRKEGWEGSVCIYSTPFTAK